MSGLWNGNRAAISLTFDDGLPCQIDFALPRLEQYEVPATFFLIGNSPYDTQFRTDVWKKAIQQGHEIGSHSMNHLKASTLTVEMARHEAEDSKNLIETRLNSKVTSYCYPFTDAIVTIQDQVKKVYKQARGGRVARSNKFVCKGDGVNLFDVPCFHVNDGQFENLPIWIDAALERNAWFTLMFHAVGDEKGWDNVNPHTFAKMLSVIRDAKNRGLWPATFEDAAESLRQNG